VSNTSTRSSSGTLITWHTRRATCSTPWRRSPTRKPNCASFGVHGAEPLASRQANHPEGRLGLFGAPPRSGAVLQTMACTQYLHSVFSTAKGNGFLLVLTVRCCRSLPPRCYVTVLCFSNTVLQLCLAVSHVCLCGRRHLSRQSGPRFNQKDRLLKRRGEKPGLHRTARAGNFDRSCGPWPLSKHTQTPKCSPLELTQNLRPSSSAQAQYPASF